LGKRSIEITSVLSGFNRRFNLRVTDFIALSLRAMYAERHDA
jgi:hypothetical protein